jgi:GNAT superfamily N-acetyltransferase
MIERIMLPPAGPADFAFCERLYFEEMGWIVRAMRLDAAKQRESFPRQWRSEQVRVIAVPGSDVGWLRIVPTNETISLGQLYLAADFQRPGIGTEVLRMLFEETASSGKAITLGIVKINPARRHYQRLRFRIITDEDQHICGASRTSAANAVRHQSRIISLNGSSFLNVGRA